MTLSTKTLIGFAITVEHIVRTFVKLPFPQGLDDQSFAVAQKIVDAYSNHAMDDLILDAEEATKLLATLVGMPIPPALADEVTQIIVTLYHVINDHALTASEIPSAAQPTA